MPNTLIQWDWRDAFSKFGFDDGDGWNGTDLVSDFMEKEFGLNIYCETWGCHNYLIMEVCKKTDKKGKEVNLIPQDTDFTHGYDEPDDWMPQEWIDKLDDHFDDDYQVGAY